MSIFGVGCDIVKIARIAKSIAEHGDRFLQKIYTDSEIAAAPDNPDKRVAFFAKRFAAKEAVSKALGTGIGANIAFKDIEISNSLNGKPTVTIHKDSFDYAIMLSLSDEHEYAMAYCIICNHI